MATSRRVRPLPAASFAEQAVALAWGAWSELGVSGWTHTMRDWVVDPEPLIVFTASLDGEDPRLTDEATDWCVRNWRAVSKVRLRNLVRDQNAATRTSFGTFAATVGKHAGITWPAATTARRFTTTGRSSAPELDRPSMAWLRLRAIFGLGARTEVLRFFLSIDSGSASVATIASDTNYNKRVVAEECEALERAGVLSVLTRANRYYYSLSRRDELEALLGPRATQTPSWIEMFGVANELIALEREVAGSTPRTLAVKASATLRTVEPLLEVLDIDIPGTDTTGAALWPAVQELGCSTLGAWSLGQWELDDRQRSMVRRRVRSQRG